MDVQKLFDEISRGHRAERGLEQMTLRKLIDLLETLDGELEIVGLGRVDSYRGYYSDLAFEPDDTPRIVEDLLDECKNSLGKTFEGYKGGDNLMDEHTPLWVSSYGISSDLKLMGFVLGNSPIQVITEKDEWDY